MSTSAWFGKWVRKIFSGPWIESRIKFGNLPVDGIPPMNPKPFNDEFPEIVRPEGVVNARVLYFSWLRHQLRLWRCREGGCVGFDTDGSAG